MFWRLRGSPRTKCAYLAHVLFAGLHAGSLGYESVRAKENGMKKCLGEMNSGIWAAWAMAALLVALMTPQTTLGADRVVLCEEFTSTT